jgi:hypothetical protein
MRSLRSSEEQNKAVASRRKKEEGGYTFFLWGEDGYFNL